MSFEIIKEQIVNLPETSGVYQFFDQEKKILYVGKAKNLKKRVQSYVNPNNLSARIFHMVNLAEKIEFIQTRNELEALLLEHNLIKKLSPKFNILLKDDKTFPFIQITNHQFPRILKFRGENNKQSIFFGPFVNANDVESTIHNLRKIFLLRNCSDQEFKSRKKPCLEYQIKKCSAPCVSLIEKGEYQKSVENVINFLNGKSSQIQENLAEKMRLFSEKQEYEKAAQIRDQIKSLSAIQAKQNINISLLENADIFTIATKNNLICIYVAFYRNGQNYGSKPYFFELKNEQNLSEILSDFLGQFYLQYFPPKLILTNLKLDDNDLIENFLSEIAGEKIEIKFPQQGEKFRIIEDQTKIANQINEQEIIKKLSGEKFFFEIKKTFDLRTIPKKIEVYDNSHISGTNRVGTLISVGKDGFIKNGYRKFNLESGDDTAMLKEVLTRRFSKLAKEDFPDFIIIDGGLPQMNAAKEVFDKLQIDIEFICMAKGQKRNAGEEKFHQIGKEVFSFPKHHPVLHFLQNLRDEAHRFAIGTHRKKRDKSYQKSSLDDIENIGKVRKKALLNHFGSVEKIKSASKEELARVSGISKKTAEKIFDSIRRV
jgi:excinuclease ABC subunit C